MFRAQLLTKVLDGTKTMTRRPMRHALDAKCPYQVGKLNAVQPGRGKYHVAHLRPVVETRHERVGFITEEDARKEGFASVEEFVAYWVALYGQWTPDAPVCVIEFDTLQVGCCPKWVIADA